MTPEEQQAEVQRIERALAALFDPSEVKFRAAVVSGNRAMCLAYIDARVVQDRLDEVVGCLGWKDEYTVLPEGSVICTLSLKIAGEWVSKVDVGSQSEQPDGGDRVKAAFSDALKRAAVKFGIGRALYRLPSQWIDWDAGKKQFAKTPRLPDWWIKGVADATATRVEPTPAQDPYVHGRLTAAAHTGTKTLGEAWKALSLEEQKAFARDKERLKAIAAEVDRHATA